MKAEFKLIRGTHDFETNITDDIKQLHVIFSDGDIVKSTIFREQDSVAQIFKEAEFFEKDAKQNKKSEFTDEQKKEILLRHNWFYWKEHNAYMLNTDMAKGFSLEEAFKIQLEQNRKARLNQIFGNNFKKTVAEYPLTPEEAFTESEKYEGDIHFLDISKIKVNTMDEFEKLKSYVKETEVQKPDSELSLMELYEKYINPKPDGAEIHWFHQMFDIGIYVPKIETIDDGQSYFDATEEHQKEKYRKARAWIMYNRKLKNNMENEKRASDYGHFEKVTSKDYTLEELQELSTDHLFALIRQWSVDRGFYGEGGATIPSQFVKLIEEAGELAGNIARGKDVKDDIGDVSVVLTVLATQHKTNMRDCLAQAYFDIKDRKGQWVNGSFVKEKDLDQKSNPYDMSKAEDIIHKFTDQPLKYKLDFEGGKDYKKKD